MKTKFIKRGMSGLMAVLMAVTAFIGLGATTAFAASETAESYKKEYSDSFFTHLFYRLIA